MKTQSTSRPYIPSQLNQEEALSSRDNTTHPLSLEKTTIVARSSFSFFSRIGIAYVQAGVLLYSTHVAINNPSQFIVELPITATVFCSLIAVQSLLYPRLIKKTS